MTDPREAEDRAARREESVQRSRDHLRMLPQRLETDAESVERDLLRLVLTIVELIRQLMEKQALRRVEEGDLTDEQIEGLGNGLMHLEQAMEDLKARYDLTAADLNIDLGPLGTLLSD